MIQGEQNPTGDLRSRIARVIRSARKSRGSSQIQFAKKLGLKQSALSKAEKGTLPISVETLFRFCEVTGIPADQVARGYIETIERAELKSSEDLGLYKMPKRYLYNRGSKVRACIPIIRHFQRTLGYRAFDEYLASQRIDPDFFVNLDHQVNILFGVDAFRAMVSGGVLHLDNLNAITQEVANPTMHGGGKLLKPYREITAFQDSIKRIVRVMGYYECNVDYALEGESIDSIDLSIRPRWHIHTKAYQYDSVLKNLICEYRKSWSRNLLESTNSLDVQIEEVECYHKGGRKCVYRYRLATKS